MTRVASKAVTDLITKRKTDLAIIMERCDKPLTPLAEELLITLHANVVSSYAAVDEVKHLMDAQYQFVS